MSNRVVQPQQRRRWRRVRRVLLVLAALPFAMLGAFHLAVLCWPYPKGIDRLPGDSTFLLDRQGRPLAQFVSSDDQWRMKLSHEQISPHLLNAIVAIEDARFFEHGGVDWKSAAGALWEDLSSLRFKRGGSTITMQLHRRRQPAPRSLFAKIEQAVRAAQIEKQLDKRRILVEYLNRAPFGGNIEGAGAASWRYFGKPCSELSLAQAALLAGLPKNPTHDRPDRFPDRARARRDLVLGRMLKLNMIAASEHAIALAEPVEIVAGSLTQMSDPAIRAALPTLLNLARESPGGAARTTIDLATQQIAASAAARAMEQEGDRIGEVAVVVLDHATARCVAAVSLSRQGGNGLDLTQCARSTGSAIKPFIYAAAFDAGICGPQTMLDDSPAAWPNYVPVNYDLHFKGRMTAAQALAQSRNIPALRLLSEIGVHRAAGVCSAVGLSTLGQKPDRYGLSMAIGGAEATPLEMAQAYAALARGGRFLEARWLADEPAARVAGSGQALSARACRDVLAALGDSARTKAICPEAERLNIAWKTGTSSGHRDAWCAAVGPAHVVVVWMGNASGQGARSLVGSEAAAPLALQLLAQIDATAAPSVRPSIVELSSQNQRKPIDRPLTIISPAGQSEIVWMADVPAAQQRVMLRAIVADQSGAAQTLYWFADGQSVGTSMPGEALWWEPRPGRHELRVVDEHGQSAHVRIRVR